MGKLSTPLAAAIALALSGAAHAATGGAVSPSTPALSPSQQTSGSVASGQATSGNAATGQMSAGTGTGRATPLRPAPFDAPLEGAAITPGAAAAFTIGANGERIPVPVAGSTLPAPVEVTATPTLDAAARVTVRRERAKVARKQQLMHSIVPRTENDRTDQMPDDPPSPALTLPSEPLRTR